MDQQTLLYIMAAFVAISAIALCLQLATLFGMYRIAKALQGKVTPLLPKVEAVVDSAKSTIDDSRKQIVDITVKANQIMDSTKVSVARMEEVINEATGRAKVQMERVEMVVDDTMSRAHETVATVHAGIMRPVREISGITAGIRTALAQLARGGRPSVDQATSDEEMFI